MLNNQMTKRTPLPKHGALKPREIQGNFEAAIGDLILEASIGLTRDTARAGEYRALITELNRCWPITADISHQLAKIREFRALCA
jgi:hypothetical protein